MVISNCVHFSQNNLCCLCRNQSPLGTYITSLFKDRWQSVQCLDLVPSYPMTNTAMSQCRKPYLRTECKTWIHTTRLMNHHVQIWDQHLPCKGSIRFLLRARIIALVTTLDHIIVGAERRKQQGCNLLLVPRKVIPMKMILSLFFIIFVCTWWVIHQMEKR